MGQFRLSQDFYHSIAPKPSQLDDLYFFLLVILLKASHWTSLPVFISAEISGNVAKSLICAFQLIKQMK